MSKIVLEIEPKNKETVLMILKNLKQGLIKNITVDNKKIAENLEEKSYKKQKIIEDEFMPKTQSTGKYLSKTDFKAKLMGKKN